MSNDVAELIVSKLNVELQAELDHYKDLLYQVRFEYDLYQAGYKCYVQKCAECNKHFFDSEIHEGAIICHSCERAYCKTCMPIVKSYAEFYRCSRCEGQYCEHCVVDIYEHRCPLLGEAKIVLATAHSFFASP